jgi:peroxiredoxin Q/BCP
MERLKVGDSAPIFYLFNQQNTNVNIKSYRGKSILLYFFLRPLTIRYSQCARELNQIKMRNDNLIVLGISPDLPKKNLNFFQKVDLNYDLLSDPNRIIAKKYGAWEPNKTLGPEQMMSALRSAYVIGSNGKIKNIFDNLEEVSSLELFSIRS